METNHVCRNPVDNETPNSLAAVWSMMLPGLGQMMKGRVLPGVCWGLLVSSGYFAYFWPGITLHVLCVLDAGLYKGAPEHNRLRFAGVLLGLVSYIFLRNHY